MRWPEGARDKRQEGVGDGKEVRKVRQVRQTPKPVELELEEVVDNPDVSFADDSFDDPPYKPDLQKQVLSLT